MFKDTELGHTTENESVLVFFGKKPATLTALQNTYKSYTFSTLHQIHSDICVPAKLGEEQKADAHFTYDRNIALVIKTADCVPLMIHCPTTDTVLAIHAGWRGLKSEIIKKSIQKAYPYSNMSKLQVWIGPFIDVANYEFSKTDIDTLKNVSPTDYYQEKNGNYYLDVGAIVKHQLQQCRLDESRCHFLNIDTFTSQEHYSYRQGKGTDQRLYHFIVNRRG